MRDLRQYAALCGGPVSIARGRRWLDELITDPAANTESIADREGCSARRVNMTISLAFLAPKPREGSH
jgi:hypothetical protein